MFANISPPPQLNTCQNQSIIPLQNSVNTELLTYRQFKYKNQLNSVITEFCIYCNIIHLLILNYYVGGPTTINFTDISISLITEALFYQAVTPKLHYSVNTEMLKYRFTESLKY